MSELVQPPPEAKSLPSPPTDATSSLSYLPDNDSISLLASSSWDGSVRVHNTTMTCPELKLVHSMETGPLLSLAVESKTLYTGSLDGSVQMLDIESKTPQLIGRHQAGAAGAAGKANGTVGTSNSNACSCLVALPSAQPLLASASWNRKFHIWDVRQSSPATTVDLPGKAFAMDVDTLHSRVVIGCSGRRTCLIDIRRIPSGVPADSSWDAEMVLNAESSQKHQTRCVRFFADGNAIAIGSVEGRVSVESVTERDVSAMKKIYAFKCHREGDLVYPVNCIDFHPRFGTFATGGCDGTVVTWDGQNRKRLTTLPKFPTSIAALAFNHDGSQLAIASSYTFEDGEKDHPRDEIFVKEMLDSECTPKSLNQDD